MEEGQAEPQRLFVTVNLNRDGVVRPALQALQTAGGSIVLSLRALETADLTGPVAVNGPLMAFQFEGVAGDADARRAKYRDWLLAKGFQDLARGLRESLEEAFVWVKVVEMRGQPVPACGVEALLEEFRAAANARNFPDLLAAVNAGLSAPLHWEAAFRSLQKTRNCLEHRGGVVSQNKDAGAGELSLKLWIPRMRLTVMQGGEEVELVAGLQLQEGSEVTMQSTTREYEYLVGQRISFSPDDFGEIAFACWMMSQDLVSKLPDPAA